MKSLLSIILLIAMPAFAHIDGHTPDPQAPAALTCYSLAARASWGAYAQTLGAPPTFKFASYDRLRSIFFGTRADVPVDGIYILEDMNADETAAYQRQALVGYEWAKNTPDAKVLSREQLMAIFVDQICNGK